MARRAESDGQQASDGRSAAWRGELNRMGSKPPMVEAPQGAES
jgi:hypothetical protein